MGDGVGGRRARNRTWTLGFPSMIRSMIPETYRGSGPEAKGPIVEMTSWVKQSAHGSLTNRALSRRYLSTSLIAVKCHTFDSEVHPHRTGVPG